MPQERWQNYTTRDFRDSQTDQRRVRYPPGDLLSLAAMSQVA